MLMQLEDPVGPLIKLLSDNSAQKLTVAELEKALDLFKNNFDIDASYSAQDLQHKLGIAELVSTWKAALSASSKQFKTLVTKLKDLSKQAVQIIKHLSSFGDILEPSEAVFTKFDALKASVDSFDNEIANCRVELEDYHLEQFDFLHQSMDWIEGVFKVSSYLFQIALSFHRL